MYTIRVLEFFIVKIKFFDDINIGSFSYVLFYV